jgi:hypothetical protein
MNLATHPDQGKRLLAVNIKRIISVLKFCEVKKGDIQAMDLILVIAPFLYLL